MIILVTPKVAHDFVSTWCDTKNKKETSPSLLLTKSDASENWVAIDNSTGDCNVEEFETQERAVSWLNGEFEIGDEV